MCCCQENDIPEICLGGCMNTLAKRDKIMSKKKLIKPQPMMVLSSVSIIKMCNTNYRIINQFKDYLELSSCFIWDRMSFFFKPIVNHMVTLLLGVGGRCKENVSNIDSTITE